MFDDDVKVDPWPCAIIIILRQRVTISRQTIFLYAGISTSSKIASLERASISRIQIVKQWRTTERRAVQAESEKANAELSFLRAQINPHFLFNTLNNIYSLILTKNDAAPEAVLKLPHIMRYVTDEAMEERVPLEWEVQCISRYIELPVGDSYISQVQEWIKK